MKPRFFTLPNLMTLYRFPAGPAMLWLLLQMNPANYPQLFGGYPAWLSVTGVILAVLVFLTDFYDGRLARRYNSVTNFGKMADPIADSLFFTLFLLGLALSPRFQVSGWFTVIMIYREAGVQVIRRIAALKGVVLMAGAAGKLKMALQGVAAGIFGLAVMFKDLKLLNIGENVLIALAWIAAAAAALCGILSLAAYVKQLPAMMQTQSDSANCENQTPAAPK